MHHMFKGAIKALDAMNFDIFYYLSMAQVTENETKYTLFDFESKKSCSQTSDTLLTYAIWLLNIKKSQQIEQKMIQKYIQLIIFLLTKTQKVQEISNTYSLSEAILSLCNEQIAKQLITHYHADSYVYSFIYTAIQKKKYHIARLCLQDYLKKNTTFPFFEIKKKSSLLFLLAQQPPTILEIQAYELLFTLLLDKGFNPHYVHHTKQDILSIYQGSMSILKQLIHYLNQSKKQSTQECERFFEACKLGNIILVQNMVQASLKYLVMTNEQGQLGLDIALQYHQTPIILLLISIPNLAFRNPNIQENALICLITHQILSTQKKDLIFNILWYCLNKTRLFNQVCKDIKNKTPHLKWIDIILKTILPQYITNEEYLTSINIISKLAQYIHSLEGNTKFKDNNMKVLLLLINILSYKMTINDYNVLSVTQKSFFWSVIKENSYLHWKLNEQTYWQGINLNENQQNNPLSITTETTA